MGGWRKPAGSLGIHTLNLKKRETSIPQHSTPIQNKEIGKKLQDDPCHGIIPDLFNTLKDMTPEEQEVLLKMV